MTTPPADLSVNSWNPDYLDAMYQRWRTDPASVPGEWQQFFRGFELGLAEGRDGGGGAAIAHTKQGRVDSLIYHYRDIGHFAACLDPLKSERRPPDELDLSAFNLSEADLEEAFDPGLLPLDNPATLLAILERLQDTYCGRIGVEYMHIQNPERRRWLQSRMEKVANRPPFTREEKAVVLGHLVQASGFEGFLDKRYKGTKRFGLDGGEALIPMLLEIVELAPQHGVQEYTIGMAHRGRLNVLANILAQGPRPDIFDRVRGQPRASPTTWRAPAT